MVVKMFTLVDESTIGFLTTATIWLIGIFLGIIGISHSNMKDVEDRQSKNYMYQNIILRTIYGMPFPFIGFFFLIFYHLFPYDILVCISFSLTITTFLIIAHITIYYCISLTKILGPHNHL